MVDLGGLGTIVALLLIGLVSGGLLRRIGISPIVGYLIAGALIGGHGLGLIHESEMTHLLAEVGVVFLLFDIGLHLSLRDLWASRRDLFVFGPSQVLVCAILIGGALYALGIPPGAAVIAAGALALSSTALVVQGLIERKMQSTPLGRKSIAVLIFQDIFAVGMLVLIQMLGTEQEGSVAAALGWALVKALGAVAAVMFVGRFVLKPAFRWIVNAQQEEVFTTAALAVVLGTAMVTGFAGLSLPLGAFLAGLILSESEYCYMVKAEVRPFRALLLSFFFLTVGMMLDVSIIWNEPALVLIVVAFLVGVKAIIIFGIARAAGLSTAPGIRLAFSLAQGSEFAFVVFSLALSQGLMESETVSALVAAVTVSMLLTPALVGIGDHLAARLSVVGSSSASTAQETASDVAGRILILGFDSVARVLARALSAANTEYVVATNDLNSFAEAQAEGFSVSYGDPSDPPFLSAAGATSANAIVVALADADERAALARQIKHQFPQRSVLCTSSTAPGHSSQDEESAVQAVVKDLLDQLGIESDTAGRILGRERREKQVEETAGLIAARAG